MPPGVRVCSVYAASARSLRPRPRLFSHRREQQRAKRKLRKTKLSRPAAFWDLRIASIVLPPPPPPPLPPVLQDNEGPRHTRLHSKHVVTGITEQRCESHEIRTPSRAGICLDLCAARHMHTRTTLPHERDRNNCDIKSPALQCRRVTSFCGCAKRRGSKPQLSPDSSLHPQHGWRVPAAAPVDVATLRCRTRPKYLRRG